MGKRMIPFQVISELIVILKLYFSTFFSLFGAFQNVFPKFGVVHIVIAFVWEFFVGNHSMGEKEGEEDSLLVGHWFQLSFSLHSLSLSLSLPFIL